MKDNGRIILFANISAPKADADDEDQEDEHLYKELAWSSARTMNADRRFSSYWKVTSSAIEAKTLTKNRHFRVSPARSRCRRCSMRKLKNHHKMRSHGVIDDAANWRGSVLYAKRQLINMICAWFSATFQATCTLMLCDFLLFFFWTNAAVFLNEDSCFCFSEDGCLTSS